MPLDKIIATILTCLTPFATLIWVLSTRKSTGGLRIIVNTVFEPKPTPKCVWWMVPVGLILLGAIMLVLVLPNM